MNVPVEVQEMQAKAAADGYQRGVIDTKLDQLLRGQQETAKTLNDMVTSMQLQAQNVTRIDAEQRSQAADILELKGQLSGVQRDMPTKTEVTGINTRLESVEASLRNFLLKLVVAGLTGAGGFGALQFAVQQGVHWRVIP